MEVRKQKDKMNRSTKYNCGKCREVGHNVRTCQNEEKPAEKKRKRGGQPGNTNAVQHGFFSRRFLKGEIETLDLMEEYNDISSEIKLVRIALDRAITRMTGEIDIDRTVALLNAIVRGAAKIGHLKKIQELLFSESQGLSEFLEEALSKVIDEFERESTLDWPHSPHPSDVLREN